MMFLAKLLGTTGTGGWIIYAVLAGVIATSAGLAGAKVQRMITAPTISQLRVDVAKANEDAQKTRTALAEQQKVIALDLAKANALALEQRTTLEAKVTQLTVQLTAAEKARHEASTRLLDTLKAIPHDQQISLSPPIRQYLRDVVRQQSPAVPAAVAPDHR